MVAAEVGRSGFHCPGCHARLSTDPDPNSDPHPAPLSYGPLTVAEYILGLVILAGGAWGYRVFSGTPAPDSTAPAVASHQENAKSGKSNDVHPPSTGGERGDFRHQPRAFTPQGEFETGLQYLYGIGVTANGPKAYEALRRAASRGHAKAQYVLGSCGDGTDFRLRTMLRKKGLKVKEGSQWNVGVEERIRWLKAATKSGMPEAAFNLGALISGRTMDAPEPNSSSNDLEKWEADQREALTWFKLAAERGHQEGQHEMAYRLFQGVGTAPDRNRAERWWAKMHPSWNKTLSAWDKEHPFDAKRAATVKGYDARRAKLEIRTYRVTDDPGLTAKIAELEAAATRGDTKAILELALRSRSPQRVERPRPPGVSSNVWISTRPVNHGVPYSTSRAIELYERALVLGTLPDTPSLQWIITTYWRDRLNPSYKYSPRHRPMAIRWYKRFERQDPQEAHATMARLLQEDETADETSISLAMSLASKASAKSSDGFLNSMATVLLKGIHLRKNNYEAARLASMAARRGSGEAWWILADLYSGNGLPTAKVQYGDAMSACRARSAARGYREALDFYATRARVDREFRRAEWDAWRLEQKLRGNVNPPDAEPPPPLRGVVVAKRIPDTDLLRDKHPPTAVEPPLQN